MRNNPKWTTQATRVKRAWRAARKIGPCNKDSNSLANIWYDADQSAMEQIISQAKLQFSERYKTAYPPKIAPADKLLFRCYREMEERHLTCHNIRKVKNQLNEFADLEEEEVYATSDRREQRGFGKRKATEEPMPYSVKEYMAKLYTYLLALAVVGSDKVHGAPPEEAVGSDSTMFVQTPWDTLQSYYFFEFLVQSPRFQRHQG